jgi:hypothetical protein
LWRRLMATKDQRTKAHQRRVWLNRMAEPAVTVDGPAMQGEAEPLAWASGRGPVLPEEVLGNMRRRQRIQQQENPDQPVELAERLPDWNDKKMQVGLRIPRVLNEYLHTLALIEGMPFTAIIEEALLEKALSIPRNPEAARKHFLRLQEQMRTGQLDIEVLRTQVTDMLAQINKLAEQQMSQRDAAL